MLQACGRRTYGGVHVHTLNGNVAVNLKDGLPFTRGDMDDTDDMNLLSDDAMTPIHTDFPRRIGTGCVRVVLDE